MKWVEKRPKGIDANLKQTGGQWNVRVRLKLPDGTLFERELVAATKAAARKTRDDVYAAYNDLALSILAGEDQRVSKPRPDGMVLQDLANRCRDEWWPARGRSVDISEQYFQKLRDYVIPALGADRPVSSIDADDWDRVLELDANDLLIVLGGLPEGKRHFAGMAIDAMRSALYSEEGECEMADPGFPGFGGRVARFHSNEDGYLDVLALRRGADEDGDHRHTIPVCRNARLLRGRLRQALCESTKLSASAR